MLFIVTLISTLVAGALMQDYDFMAGFPGSIPGGLLSGVTFAVPLLLILGSHEFAHYHSSRRHGVRATLPYFIPFPNIFGTMGAVIKIKSPIFDRRALVDIGASGPIVGFILAVIATSAGLYLSTPMESMVAESNDFTLGPSILFYALANIFAPQWQTAGALDLHPLAVAGWVGLFVTSINLMPVGQLDGGHIAYAFLGRYQTKLSFAFIGLLGLMGLVLFPGWIIWALLLVWIGLRHPPVLDERGKIGTDRIITGIVSLIIFIVTFTPVPVIIHMGD